MTKQIERLRAHGKVFDEMAERHLRHHYQDVQAQGVKHVELANAFHGAADEIERQATFIEFVFRWVTDEKMTDAEIVSILKHHPRLQDMLAARVAVTAGERGT